MPPPTHPCIIKSGYLTQKRSALSSSKKYLILCTPLSVQDIQGVYNAIFKLDPATTLDVKTVSWLGNIACAAVRGTPLLIILPSDTPTPTTTPTFLHFSDIRSISDESQLRSACNFAIHMDVKPYDYRFAASSSTEYQDWNKAFGKAMNILTDRTMGGNHIDSNLSSPTIHEEFPFEQLNHHGATYYNEPLTMDREEDDTSTTLAQTQSEIIRLRTHSPPPPSPSSKPKPRTLVLPDDVAPPHSTRTYVLPPQSPTIAQRPSSASSGASGKSAGTGTGSKSATNSVGTQKEEVESNGGDRPLTTGEL